jgi:hypothetical protein
MSYDLIITAKFEGEGWEETLARLEDEADAPSSSLSDSARSQWEQIAEQLADSGFERLDAPDFIELDLPAHGIQITMFEREIGLSVPYWYEGEEAQEVLALVGEAINVIRGVSGWAVYDPQLEREITNVADLAQAGDALSATTRQVQEVIGDGVSTDIEPDEYRPPQGSESRPWWRFWNRRT